MGDPIAVRAACTSGHVFFGRLDVPAIDHRPDMEPELDMRHSHRSIATRQRVLQNMGHREHRVVWFTDTIPSTPKAGLTLEALAVMDQWLTNLRPNPAAGIAASKPPTTADACYDLNGQLMQAGAGVWCGIVDGGSPGACGGSRPGRSRP